MKFKDVFFRKMTILYFVIMFFLGCAFFVTVKNYSVIKSSIEDSFATEATIMIESDKPLGDVKEATNIYPVKRLNGNIFHIIIDRKLTGDECKRNVIFSDDTSIGSIFNPTGKDDFSCKVVGFKSGIASEIYVSEEKYNSYESNTYSALVTVNSIKNYKKLEKKYNAYNSLRIPCTGEEYDNYVVMLNSYFYSSVVIAVIIALLIIVIFMNIRGYIKHNTKKTKKKKQESTTKLLVISTLLTTVVPLVLSYVLVILYILDVIYSY